MSMLKSMSLSKKIKSFVITGVYSPESFGSGDKFEKIFIGSSETDAWNYMDYDWMSDPCFVENIKIKNIDLQISCKAFAKIKKELSTSHSHSVDIRKQLRKDGQFHRFFHRHFEGMFDSLRNVNLKDEGYIIKDRLDFYKNLKGILDHEIYMIENE